MHATKSSREEFEWLSHLEGKYPDIIHGFNCKTKLPRFCNSIPDGISYNAKTLFYYHGVSFELYNSKILGDKNVMISKIIINMNRIALVCNSWRPLSRG